MMLVAMIMTMIMTVIEIVIVIVLMIVLMIVCVNAVVLAGALERLPHRELPVFLQRLLFDRHLFNEPGEDFVREEALI